MHHARRLLIVLLVTALALGAGIASGRGASAQTTGPTIPVGSQAVGYAVNYFGAPDITVTAGTTVTFRANSIESHTVTFTDLTPPAGVLPNTPIDLSKPYTYDGSSYLSTGLYNMTSTNQLFRVSFPKTGAFKYVCAIHPLQTGVVNVAAPGARTTTQAEINVISEKTFADGLAALKAFEPSVATKPVTQTRNTDGSTTWRVVSVGGQVGPSDLQLFSPATLAIRAGDTVTWHSDVTAPHIVTFLDGRPVPVGPAAQAPSSMPLPASYDGTGFLNSGAFGVGRGTQDFMLRFTRAGTFAYVCAPHVGQGMVASITVAGTAPLPPATGGAGMLGIDSPLAAALLVGALRFSTRRIE